MHYAQPSGYNLGTEIGRQTTRFLYPEKQVTR